MFIVSLYLKNFRRHRELFLEFSPGVNLIMGKNASGKTTVLEAMNLLLSGRSFRTRQLKDVISHGEHYFIVQATFKKCNIEQTIRFAFDGKDKSIFYNSTKCKSSSELLGLLQGTTLLPEDINIIKGSPGARRNFLDLQLVQIDPMYVRKLTRYYLAMRQRNYLLKKKTSHAIEAYEKEMARAAAYIVHKRLETVDGLKKVSEKVVDALSSGEELLYICYKASLMEKGEFFEQYAVNQFKLHRSKEMQFGYSIIGPHKDDMDIFIGKKSAKNFASEGQQKSIACALKFAEWERNSSLSDHTPIMLIDDIGTSLDKTRRDNVVNRTLSFKQVFITTTDHMDIKGQKVFLL